jgi:hypothetical protein
MTRPAMDAPAMRLFRYENIHFRAKVLVYARNEIEACEYMAKAPITWHLNPKPEQLREVVPPKGPSPSILSYETRNGYDEG